jgi:IS30 family transposase
MGTNYTHLEIEERCRLRGLMEMALGIGEIAPRLKRDPVTVHREIEHKHCVEGYRPDSAQRRA